MKNKIVTFVFALLLIASAVLFAMPPDTESFKHENRNPAALPELSEESFFSGNFSTQFENYVNDNISYRSEFVKLGNYISKNKGITPPSGRIVYTNKDIGTKTVKKACMLIVDGKIMEVFRKNPDSEKKYADAINKISSSISEKINVYSALVPTQLEFCDKLYSGIQTGQKQTIDEIYSMLNPRVKTVDIYSALQNHTDEYIYFRTDHHWTMLGAYYGYSAFMKAQNLPPANISDFEKHSINGMLGYLYEQSPDSEAAKNPDTLEWYDTRKGNDIDVSMESINKNGSVRKYTSPMFDTTKKNYSFFFSADHPYTHIENKKILNKKTLLVIKDSYASDFVPWCVNNYSDIIMIDPRTYKENLRDVFKQIQIDDVLILNYIFTTSFEDYCDIMSNMFK